ncbi:Low molecular weight protein tyrosine phosphatase (EC 3.1.3.48) [uncultured Gammaproteobacteria bacterium]|uniref:Uncharacterized protein n=3 Tax=Bathymodiolus azoricus thioautotrophic gill symbiont TaxID=235205 RepID=A0ACA8ZU32_9GAMM|nr:hypothetical protein AZO1586R_1093 [Bathymodiolus azoricus thioautotrophic gill symbiont]CAC9512878.1 Low molecular weight protein tyrosine phosphatase (EC 3.1.3.48) [uncultured Gammaproteobacteria bacterium]CAC9518443.1 Low molecular weight protein tyrosine phosphatase (EC 3.1.3.48) [uncultured Gammaproteobacteria bacterium]CAC9518543.1 Low molecular weight protein tyrosine phosphatase (EC 3.1.3.48) [uncultured Gammaproteobacteria bacterium]SEH81774.1 [weak similarity to] IS1016 transposase
MGKNWILLIIPIYAKVSNGIESFWGYAKNRLVKFKGMNKSMFNLDLKECEFRFNNLKQNIYKILLGMFRKESLKLS